MRGTVINFHLKKYSSHTTYTRRICFRLACFTTITKYNFNGKTFLRNRANRRKLKSVIWKTVIFLSVVSAWRILSSFRPIVLRKPCLHPISSFSVIHNIPGIQIFVNTLINNYWGSQSFPSILHLDL